MKDLDEFSKQLKAQADAKFELKAARKTLTERIEQMLFVTVNGGLFKVTPELIAFVSCWDTDTLYLKDLYDRPIELDRMEILGKFKQAYQCAMNEWHLEFNKLVKVRKAADV